MSADGVWKITINTPMGPQEVTATIATAGDAFTGRTESPMGSQDIAGKVAGDTLTWSSSVTQPMPLTLDFNVTVAGDAMTGTVKLGMFGNANLTGKRA
jgi:hypothetical protein